MEMGLHLSESLIIAHRVICKILYSDQWKREQRALYGEFTHRGTKLYCEKQGFVMYLCRMAS